MKYCEQCDEQYPSEYAFCKTCGSSLANFEGTVRICPSCGTGSPEVYRFCQACGSSMSTAGLASGVRAPGFQLAGDNIASAPLPLKPIGSDDEDTDPLPELDEVRPPIVAPFESLRPEERIPPARTFLAGGATPARAKERP